jgi:hypothetical protein
VRAFGNRTAKCGAGRPVSSGRSLISRELPSRTPRTPRTPRIFWVSRGAARRGSSRVGRGVRARAEGDSTGRREGRKVSFGLARGGRARRFTLRAWGCGCLRASGISLGARRTWRDATPIGVQHETQKIDPNSFAPSLRSSLRCGARDLADRAALGLRSGRAFLFPRIGSGPSRAERTRREALTSARSMCRQMRSTRVVRPGCFLRLEACASRCAPRA